MLVFILLYHLFTDMAYQAFREHGFPTYYGENKTAWQADITEAGLIFAFCIVAASFYIILPGIRGKEVGTHMYNL